MAARKTKPPGRPKGIPNKLPGTVKENIVCVFTRLGGTAAMARWAEENQTEFYKIYAKLLPVEVQSPTGGPLEIIVKLRPHGEPDAGA